jgi:hypothetical protein
VNLQFWRNPEFVRHARAELRGPRAITAGLLALVICALVGLASWAAENEKLPDFFKLFHGWLVGLQFAFAGFWAASTCGQAISRERELKTYDFLKTTRLTPVEIMIGKVTGVPIMAYFVVACTLPVSFLAGIWAGHSPLALLAVYILLVASTLFVSLLGLTISMSLEKSSSAVIALLILLPMTGFYGLAESPFPGFGGFSILPAIFQLYDVGPDSPFRSPTIFGLETSYFIVTLFLYTVCGAWLVVMLRRNLKRETDQIRLLSRWGAVGFGAFLNVLFYAFLDPKLLSVKPDYHTIAPMVISTMAVVLNGILLLLLGIAMLTPHERLKVWWRRRAAREEGYFSESGLPWPWLVAAAAVAYELLAAEAAGLSASFRINEWRLGRAAVLMLVLLVFSIRDVLFLQWCNVTNMKRPLMKGLLYLSLYYVAVSIIAAVAGVADAKFSEKVFLVATPFGAFADDGAGLRISPLVFVGLVFQLGITVFVVKAIYGRISRPAQLHRTSTTA